MSTDNTLAPCPFCGGEPSHDKMMDESLWSHSIVPWRRVYCASCEIGTVYVCEGFEPSEVEAWNRRALDARDARIAELEAELVAEAKKTASEKLRADQMTEQHRMQANMHSQAREELATLKAIASISSNSAELEPATPWHPSHGEDARGRSAPFKTVKP